MKRKKLISIASFTLLEIMIATSLIVVGVVACVRSISVGVSADQATEGKLAALNLAVQKIEALVNTTYSSISSSSDTPVTGYTRTWTITDNTNYKTIAVGVTWTYKRNQMSVNLATYLANVTSS